jgi:hypothetical protein
MNHTPAPIVKPVFSQQKRMPPWMKTVMVFPAIWCVGDGFCAGAAGFAAWNRSGVPDTNVTLLPIVRLGDTLRSFVVAGCGGFKVLATNINIAAFMELFS